MEGMKSPTRSCYNALGKESEKERKSMDAVHIRGVLEHASERPGSLLYTPQTMSSSDALSRKPICNAVRL